MKKQLILNQLDTKIKKIKFTCFTSKAKDSIEFVENSFFYSQTTYSAIYQAVKAGGDTDTNASILGELKNFHLRDISDKDVQYIESKLPKHLLNILKKFNK